jgi:hypothetical protein
MGPCLNDNAINERVVGRITLVWWIPIRRIVAKVVIRTMMLTLPGGEKTRTYATIGLHR